MKALKMILPAVEKMARRSQVALFGFTVFLLIAGLGLAGSALAYLTGFWIIFGGSVLIAVAGFAAAALVVVINQGQRTVHVGVTQRAVSKRNQVSARYN